MRLSFHGAAQTVTGSQFLFEVNGAKFLLECGLFQGRRSETYKKNKEFFFDPRTLDAVVLSHAHIDHSGNLPNLVKQGFSGQIYATHATSHLTDMMLRDSGHIQEADIQFLNRKRLRRGEPPLEPLYTIADAARVAEHFRSVHYSHPFEPVPGVVARLHDAGHILGSASIALDIEERGRKIKLWFSGDIGRIDLPLVRDPVLPNGDEDCLIMECTYGDKTHEPVEAAYEEFRAAVAETVARGGKIIIPAFAVGRTQELVYFLNRMIDAGTLQRIPVFVDSPMAINATAIFEQHPECFDEETNTFIHTHRHPALEFRGLSYTRSVEESKAINERNGPLIIISASGMAENGRILHHLRNNIGDPINTILIVSWQAPHTLGRRLAERQKEVRIFGEKHARRAKVVTIGGLSAHAGQRLLVQYALSVKSPAKGIFLVHGEERAATALSEKLRQSGAGLLHFPGHHESIEI